MWELDCEESWELKNWCFWTVVLEKTLESASDCRRSNQSILNEISPGCTLEGLMLSWNSSPLAISCEELTHWKRLWCWDGLGAGWKGDDRGWDGWMASLTWWTWVWVNSGSWWWTGRPGVLQFMGSQRVRHDWVTEVNWTERIHRFPGLGHGQLLITKHSSLGELHGKLKILLLNNPWRQTYFIFFFTCYSFPSHTK